MKNKLHERPCSYWLRDRFKDRPLSHSQLESFKYDEDRWFNTYILGEKVEPNATMRFGTLVGDSIGTDKSMVPELTPPGVKEYKLTGYIRDNLGDIHLVGYADHYCDQTLVLHENKTSDNRKKWNQESVDKHPQLTMYALLLFTQDKISPKDLKMFLNYIPTELTGVNYRLPDPVEYFQWETKRTNLQVAEYVQYIKDTVADMDMVIKLRYESTRTGLRK